MGPITTYTLPALAEATGFPEDTLRTWKTKGWLQPYAVSGNRHYYRMEEFDEAARMSREVRLAKAMEMLEEPDDPTAYDRILDKHLQGPNRAGRVRQRIRRGAL